MPSKYLHELKQFPDLLNVLSQEMNIEAAPTGLLPENPI
jgi:hypothetical protein